MQTYKNSLSKRPLTKSQTSDRLAAVVLTSGYPRLTGFQDSEPFNICCAEPVALKSLSPFFLSSSPGNRLRVHGRHQEDVE